MVTVIEMEYYRAQIAQAKALHDALPKIAEALERIALALESYISNDVDGLMAIIEATKEPKE